MIRVCVIAATPIMRAGLQSLLRAEGMIVAGEVAEVKQLSSQLAGTDLAVVAGKEVLSGLLKAGQDLSRLLWLLMDT